MNYFKLSQTTPDVLESIKKAEMEGRYSDHLDPIDYNNCNPVDEMFPYIPKGKVKVSQDLMRFFILKPFAFLVNTFIFRTKVTGRENLKGIENAIITCNHVNKLDALVVQKALKGHHLKIMVGDFNNQKGDLGKFMRTFGTMPFSPKPSVLRNFNNAVAIYLKSKTYLLFFPEQSEWWCYEKPRPLMDGAYHYAIKHNVPIIPTFITFDPSGKYDKNGIEKKYFRIHVLEPIYKNPELSKEENRKSMKERNQLEWVRTYEEYYHKEFMMQESMA